MTQLESARKGATTPEMVQAATYEGVSPEEIRCRVAEGSVVIPKNMYHAFDARGIGEGDDEDQRQHGAYCWTISVLIEEIEETARGRRGWC